MENIVVRHYEQKMKIMAYNPILIIIYNRNVDVNRARLCALLTVTTITYAMLNALL